MKPLRQKPFLFTTVVPLSLAFFLTITSAVSETKADTGKTAKAEPTRLILLGTAGGPIPRKQRSQPASLIVVKGKPYLIDAGAGTLRQLTWAGYKPTDLAAIFITHHHFDHMAGLPVLIGQNWLQRRKGAPLPIFGPDGMSSEVEGAYAFLGFFEDLTREHLPSRLAEQRPAIGRDVKKAGVVFEDENLKVTAAENSHYQLFPETKHRSYAYRFDTADRSIVFSGDTGPSDNLVALAKDADVLVAEVIDPEPTIRAAARNAGVEPNFNSVHAEHMRKQHLTAEEVGKMATAAAVKMVVLNHIAPGMDDETDMSHYSAAVKQHYKGPVIVGRDLLEI